MADGLRISALEHAESARLSNGAMPLETDKTYEALFEIGAQIQAEEINLHRVLSLIVEKAVELIEVDVAWLGLVNSDTQVIEIIAHCGARTDDFKHMELEIGRGVGGVALARRETIIVSDYGSHDQDTPAAVRSAVTEEGLVSLICAPMLRDGRMVGALYVGNREPTDFDGREASLVTALASQASIAIENSRLLEQLEAKNRLLEVSESIHRRLTDASLERAGLDGVAATLADLLGRRLLVAQDVVLPFTRQFGPDGAADAEVVGSAPILAGDDELGRVSVLGGEPLDELGLRALEHGTTVLAVELLKERTAQEVEWRLGGELFDELLARSGPIDRRLAARASRFGIDPGASHRVAVLEATEGEIDQRAIRLAAGQTVVPSRSAILLTAMGPGRVVLAIPQAFEDVLESLLARLMAVTGPQPGHAVGLSRLTTNLPRGLREALACARFASMSGQVDTIVRADDLGAMRFLFAVDDPMPLLEYVDEQLGPLLHREGRDDMQLVATLRAFLEADGHHATIAERCHIHKSTVKYRLARIAEVLGRPLSDPEVRFELRLAVAIADVLCALALAPPLEERATAVQP
jgi:GAF domain-containing protein/sugar diacid utilization regulator